MTQPRDAAHSAPDVTNDDGGPTHRADDADQASRLAERLAYLRLDETDRRRLQALGPAFDEFADDFVEAFYEHLFHFESSAQFLRNPEVVARLRQVQRDHFASLTSADWGPAYVARRLRVGHTHAQVGIDPELFLGAYNEYVQQSFRRYLTAEGMPPSPQIEGLLSLLKAVFLDLGLTLDAYFAQATQSLRQALDMYWKTNVELRQFAQLASHDLKTPLATVANFCDEALDEFGERMPGGAKDLIEAARRRALRMSTMLDELLSTTVQVNSSNDLRSVSSQAALAEAVDRLRPRMQEKQIVLSLPDALPTVRAEPVRLREAFYNVLSNAVKFIDHRPGHITVEARESDDAWEITIADDGPGIPAEFLQQIFAPFRRLPMHRERPGSGLGLYFTKMMIEHLGGRVWAESTPGAGSCFHFRLAKVDGADSPA